MKKKKTEAEKQAMRLVKQTDSFISKIKDDNPYSFAGLIAKRLIRACESDDIRDITWELEIEKGIQTVELKNLAQIMRFEEFIEGLNENPCQLKLIA